MSFLPSSRPTLPPIRDVFPDEFSSKVNPCFNSPSSTRAQPWTRNDDDEKVRPLPAQYPREQLIYESSFRYSNTEFGDSVLLHNHRLSHEHMVSLVRPDTFSSFFASPTHPQHVLPQHPFSANPVNPRFSRSISTSTDVQYAEAFEPRSIACCNSAASSAFTHPPSFTRAVQGERRNSSASYECPYCGKLFNRPSSLKIHSNSHTGEKRVYNCILNMGKIDHTKRLAFTCPVQHCGRSFSVLSNMRRHARSHGSYAVSLTESASDHYPLSLSSASSDLGLSSSSPIQSHDSHRRYGNTSSTSGSGSTSRKKNCNFSQ